MSKKSDILNPEGFTTLRAWKPSCAYICILKNPKQDTCHSSLESLFEASDKGLLCQYVALAPPKCLVPLPS